MVLRRADAIESHRAVRRLRVAELKPAGRIVCHGAQHRPVGQRKQQIRGGQNRCGVFTRVRCKSRGYVCGVTGYYGLNPIRYDGGGDVSGNGVGPGRRVGEGEMKRAIRQLRRTGQDDRGRGRWRTSDNHNLNVADEQITRTTGSRIIKDKKRIPVIFRD